mgnify:CR=1 FL=1
MKYCWFYKTAQVNSKFINKLVKDCEKKELSDGIISDFNGDYSINKDIRKAKVTFLNRKKHLPVYNLINTLGVNINNEAFGFDINQLEACQFTLYEESNSGHYDWHIDTNWLDETSMRHRKISVVIQLSDPSEYKGGELEIQDSNLNSQQLKETMQKGSVITFPSFVQHRVKPITKGKRMSLIGWVVGAKFR